MLKGFLSRLSLIILIIGIAGELLSAVRTTDLSGQVIANIEERASVNEREAAALRKEADGLRKEAEDERLKRVELQEALAPRRLDKKQQQAIGVALKPFAGQFALMLYSMVDREAEMFADDLWVALTEAHWIATEPGGIIDAKEVGKVLPAGSKITPGTDGIELSPTADEPSIRAAKALAAELEASGFDCHINKPDTNPKSGHRVQVLVTTRPLGPQSDAKLRAEAKTRHNASSQTAKR